MPSFEYTGFGRTDGGKRAGVIEAAGEKQAAKALLDAGVLADSIKPLKVRGGFGAAMRASFYRELGALLGAGLPLDRALAMMKDSPDKSFAATLAEILEKIREGSPLADAVRGAVPDAPEYEFAAVLAGERAASLPAMLPKLATLLDAGVDVRERLRSALVYPAFVMALGLVIGAVMLGFVAPRVTASLAASGMALPRSSEALMAGAKFGALGLALAAALACAAFAIAKKRAPERLDEFLLGAPLMGQARKLAALRFAWILGALADSGAPLMDALPMAGAGTGRPWLRRHSATQTERVRNGAQLSDAVGAIPVVGPELFEWVRVGEAGGCLARMLETACERLQRQWRTELERKTALLGPVILLLVGAFVFAGAFAMLMPLIDMMRAIGV